jgi:GDP-4-dehydro-6-deoxy-D-mannose reductase
MSLKGNNSEARVLITGGLGFVGGRLARLLTLRHPDWKLFRPGGPADGGGPRLDVTDQESVRSFVAEVTPDIIIHLAAVTAIGASNRAPREAWRVNLDGTLNIVFALQELAPAAHLLFVSSAEVYGASLGEHNMTDESALLKPLNPYAASKAAADILVRQVAVSGLSTCVMRPFNHTGAGQTEAFVAPNFAGQIARIEAGLQAPVLHVGSLDDERDFLDVDDVALAYALAIEARDRLPSGEVFNVASGHPVRIGDLLETLLSEARCPIEVRVDTTRLRQGVIPRVAGDAGRLKRELGWIPSIPFRTTLAGILEERRAAALA